MRRLSAVAEMNGCFNVQQFAELGSEKEATYSSPDGCFCNARSQEIFHAGSLQFILNHNSNIFPGFYTCWTSLLVKIYVGFAEDQELVVRGHLQHVLEKTAGRGYKHCVSHAAPSVPAHKWMLSGSWNAVNIERQKNILVWCGPPSRFTDGFGVIMNQLSRSSMIFFSFPCMLCFVPFHIVGY